MFRKGNVGQVVVPDGVVENEGAVAVAPGISGLGILLDDEGWYAEALESGAQGQAALAATDLARSKPLAAGAIESLTMAEASLASAMGRFQAVVESYPELKADAQMRDLSEELTHTENKVAFSRQYFNDATLLYNNAAEAFPTRVVSGLFGFKPAAMLQSTTSDAEREPVKVSF